MKITKRQLKSVIREVIEESKLLEEANEVELEDAIEGALEDWNQNYEGDVEIEQASEGNGINGTAMLNPSYLLSSGYVPKALGEAMATKEMQAEGDFTNAYPEVDLNEMYEPGNDEQLEKYDEYVREWFNADGSIWYTVEAKETGGEVTVKIAYLDDYGQPYGRTKTLYNETFDADADDATIVKEVTEAIKAN